MEADTNVAGIEKSCSVIHNNELFIYGGLSDPRQILKLDCAGQKLKVRSPLLFDFYGGACTSNNIDILLCFSENNEDQCYKSSTPAPVSWWQWFTYVRKSNFKHHPVTIAASSGQLFVTGDARHSYTELLNLSTWKWKSTVSYPADLVHSAATVFYDNKFYVFGGKSATRVLDDIMVFEPSDELWLQAGNLLSPRHQQSIKVVDDEFYVVGGLGSYKSEVCKSKAEVTCKTIGNNELSNVKKPELYSFSQQKCDIFPKPKIYTGNVTVDALLILASAENKTNSTQSSIIGLANKAFSESELFQKAKVLKGCSVAYRGEMFVYGGSENTRQMLKLECNEKSLHPKGLLQFDFVDGACATNNEHIALCFTSNSNRQCFSSAYPEPSEWWQLFISLESSKFNHELASVAMSPGKRLMVTDCRLIR